jgi:hypothetical protein
MHRITRLSVPVALPLVVAASLLAAPAAQADDRTCRGTIGATSIDGDVIVPKGATCKLVGTRVDGNVQVKANATLVARGAKVGGNIQAENHDRVVVRHRVVDDQVKRSTVGGSIQLKQGGGGKLLRVVVEGDIQLFSNDGRFVVRKNVVDGNLQCKSNTPAPVGGGNKVGGDKENQCSDL